MPDHLARNAIFKVFAPSQISTMGILTARVRSTREGNIYTWECLSVHIAGGWGTPSEVWLMGGTPSQVVLGRYPIPGLVPGKWKTLLDLSLKN